MKKTIIIAVICAIALIMQLCACAAPSGTNQQLGGGDVTAVEDRFLTYVSFDTQSSEESDTFPSTLKQLELAKYLEKELKSIGLSDVVLDENGYVYATLPASEGSEDKPVLAYIAHLDVSFSAPSADIKTHISEENGKHVIRTDGTTLLGADDKAGLSEIVTALEIMSKDPSLKHPEIRIVVTPDEETGGGVSRIDMDRVAADYAYTIDGEAVGELSYECFCGEKAKAVFTGVHVHTGSAYGIMKNPILMASEFIGLLPEDMRPETTKGREGFIYVKDISGDSIGAEINMNLRDFEQEGLEKERNILLEAAEKINEKYGAGSCEVTFSNGYRNMRDIIIPEYEYLIENVRDVYEEFGIKSIEDPIRGGTDGAELSYMGLPTPNIGTGATDCHSVNEHVAIEDLELIVQVLIKLAEKYA